MKLVRTPDKPSEPGHCGTRNSTCIIAGSGDNCNRHQSRNIAPMFPVVKLQQIVRAHDPDKADFGISRDQFFQGFCGVHGAKVAFNGGGLNRCAPRLVLRRCQPRRQRRHAFCGFQWIARRHQPPKFVEAQRIHREQANRPVATMRGVERSPHEANGFQGRICPFPRTTHL